MPSNSETARPDFILSKSGSSRHRGFEGEVSYDFLADEAVMPKEDEYKDVKQVHAETGSRFEGFHLVAFGNVQLLDAEFTDSSTLIRGTNRTLVGNEPAFAPSVFTKGRLTFRKENCFDVSLTGVYVSDEFSADSKTGTPTTPPPRSLPTKSSTFRLITT